MKPQRRAFHLPASPSFPLSVTPHARTLLCARSSGFWVVRLRDVRANKVHLGGSSLPGRLLAGNITSETFLKRIGEMFSLGGWNRSNRHAALSSRDCFESHKVALRTPRQRFPAYIKILLLWCRVRWIMVSQLRFTLLPFSFLFFFLLFLPLLFSFIPCLPRIHRKAYTRGSSNERMQIVATTLSVIFLMPS